MVGEPACSLNEEAAHSINYHATRTLLKAVDACGVSRLIFLSTCSNYGVSDPGTLVDEDAPLKPLSLYARSNLAMMGLLGLVLTSATGPKFTVNPSFARSWAIVA